MTWGDAAVTWGWFGVGASLALIAGSFLWGWRHR